MDNFKKNSNRKFTIINPNALIGMKGSFYSILFLLINNCEIEQKSITRDNKSKDNVKFATLKTEQVKQNVLKQFNEIKLNKESNLSKKSQLVLDVYDIDKKDNKENIKLKKDTKYKSTYNQCIVELKKRQILLKYEKAFYLINPTVILIDGADVFDKINEFENLSKIENKNNVQTDAGTIKENEVAVDSAVGFYTLDDEEEELTVTKEVGFGTLDDEEEISVTNEVGFGTLNDEDDDEVLIAGEQNNPSQLVGRKPIDEVIYSDAGFGTLDDDANDEEDLKATAETLGLS